MDDSSPSNLETSRKQIRTKTKKPKFLSLSLKLELNTSHEIDESPVTTTNKKKQSKTRGGAEKKRMETVGEGEKEEDQYDTVAAYLFNSTTDNSTISSIHDLLPSSAEDVDCGGGRDMPPYDIKEHGSTSTSSLLRTAMRKGASKEEATAERWVSYSEVVDEVMSRSGTPRCCGGDGNDGRTSLALKLDYEQIMEAWPDKGTLYVDGEPPQTVPDLHASADLTQYHPAFPEYRTGDFGYVTGGGEAGSLWTVPEMETTETLWRGHREASLLRYKEKRQSRLFSKRIRYQVRKLNAEKRPRVKVRPVCEERRFGFLQEGYQICGKAREAAELWYLALDLENKEESRWGVNKGDRDIEWKAPPRSCVKCNIGVGWSRKTKIAGASWVLRDHCGVVLLHSRRSFGLVESKDEANFLSVVWAMESLVSHRCLKVHFSFEGSCLVNAINRPKAWSSFNFKVKEIRSLLDRFLDWKVYIESFEANRGTRLIARSAMRDKWFQSYVSR
ncbi:hypothetical protein F2Q69_00018805, partial [Brassica cretica]